jgi:blue copper oxidase
MPIPPQLTGTTDSAGVLVYELKASAGQHAELVAGLRTPTWGYNGAVLGPTLRAPQGKPLRFEILNGLDQSTTVHWHGAHIPGAVDGGPHNLIAPGKQVTVSFTLNQPAASLWYHPHPDGRTGPQVFAGLAGFLWIDDGLDARIGMPHTYGVDDLPIVIQDRRIGEAGVLSYMPTMMDMMGMKGDHFLVNGVEQPFVEVPGQWIRLRILNGSNARIYNLAFADNRPFHVVASDAGLLERPVEVTHLVLATGERAEIMVDLNHMQGKRLVLRSNSSGVIPELNRMPMATDAYDHSQFDLLELRVGSPAGKAGRLPAQMASIPTLKADAPTRRFVLQGMEMRMMRGMMMGGNAAAPTGVSSGPGGMSLGVGGRDMFAINGTYMNMKVINERVKLGSTEIWTVANDGMMGHPFHVHGTSFQIFSRDGAPPPAHESGWKDVVLVRSGETVHLIARFDQPAGDDHPYMYHCHILEHEDNGMMGQFTVI